MGASCVRVLLLCGALLSLAVPAQAGIFYQHPLCMDQEEVFDFFSGVSFFGTDNCVALCKKTGARCKSYMARAKSCEKAAVNDETFWDKETICDVIEDPAIRKECRAAFDADAKDIKNAISAEDQVARDACDGIRDDCILACTPP